jgi:hypothetical protein
MPSAGPGRTRAWYSPPEAACPSSRETSYGPSGASVATTRSEQSPCTTFGTHTTASLLKKLHVPPRNAQMILGHAQFPTTMQIYTHVDEEARNEALAGLNNLLTPGE